MTESAKRSLDRAVQDSYRGIADEVLFTCLYDLHKSLSWSPGNYGGISANSARESAIEWVLSEECELYCNILDFELKHFKLISAAVLKDYYVRTGKKPSKNGEALIALLNKKGGAYAHATIKHGVFFNKTGRYYETASGICDAIMRYL